MKKILKLIIAVLCVVTTTQAAQTTESRDKQREILKLIHYTKALGDFESEIQNALRWFKEIRPYTTTEQLATLDREIRRDDYAQWLVALYDKALTMEELVTLNSVFSSPTKLAIYEDMGRIAQTKEGQAAVDELRERYDSGMANEMLDFVRTDVFKKYVEVLSQREAARKAQSGRLLNDALTRLRQRSKGSQKEAPEPPVTAASHPAGNAGERR